MHGYNIPYAPLLPARVLRTLYRAVVILGIAAIIAACGSTKPVGEGQYRVAKGDTLTQIARKHGQTVSSLMRMNKLSNPNHISVGQVLTVKGGAAPSSAATGSTSTYTPAPNTKSVAAPRSIKLEWPAKGTTRRGTAASNSQGVYISSTAGSPIKAAAAGKVVYAGNGLRGYGNMLIINHDANFLTVYAHNERLMVKEGAQVKQGQTIATMGNTGTDKVQLYFELRYNGKAVDATRYLP